MCRKIILGVSIIIFVLVVIGCSIKRHACTANIVWDDAIAVDTDGTVHSSGFCNICGKHISFISEDLVE